MIHPVLPTTSQGEAEVAELLRLYLHDRTDAARNAVVVACLGLAGQVASQYAPSARDAHDLADVYADACQGLITAVEGYGPAVRAWPDFAAASCHHAIIDGFRRRPLERPSPVAGVRREAARTPDAGDAIDGAVFWRRVESLLPSDQATALICRYQHGLTVAESATLTGRSIEAFRRLECQALTTLRANLGPTPPPPGSPSVSCPPPRG